MPDLESVEPEPDESLYELPATGRPRMRENRQSAARMYEIDGLTNGQSMLAYVRRSACTEIPVERVARIPRPSAFDEHARQMRPAECGVSGDGEHFVERDRNSKRIQFGDDLLPADVPTVAKYLQRVFKRRGALDVEGAPVGTADDVVRVIHDYFAAGVELYWEVDPVKRTVAVYTSLTDVVTLGIDDTLDGGDVLPGFELPLKDLFAEYDRKG